ncbi:hypothetical protein BH11PSE7_BH11PSE7_22760 [soil metagenome]
MSHTTTPFLPARQRAFAPVLLLVMALLLAQTLGFMHRIVHHPIAGAQGLQVRAQAQVAQAAPAARAHPTGVLAALFQHNEDDPSCRLYDQSSSFDTLASVPAVLLPMAVSSFILVVFEGEVLARWVALFDARGPPSIR